MEVYSYGDKGCSTVQCQSPVSSGVTWEGGGGFQLVVYNNHGRRWARRMGADLCGF